MADRWVANASPIIALGLIDRLHLLTDLAGEVTVPPAVAEEVARGGDAASRALERALGFRFPTSVTRSPTVLMWGLGSGEAEVISLALEAPNSEALLDDLAARRCAAAVGVTCRGTVGVVLAAKQRGIIPLVAPVLDQLRRAGLYLDTGLIREALALVDEAE